MIRTLQPIEIPLPLPGELINAHQQRLLTFFKLPMKSLVSHLWNQPRKRGERIFTESTHELLALHCGMTASQYVSRHSLVNISCLTLQDLQSQLTRDELLRLNCRKFGALPRCDIDVLRCPQCASQSLKDYGFTTLKRAHYIPLVDVCIEHGTAIERDSETVLRHWRPFCGGKYTPYVPQSVFDDSQHPRLQRYREVCARLLDAESASFQPAVLRRVNELLYDLPIPDPVEPVWHSVAKLIRSKLPKAWINHHLGDLMSRPRQFEQEMKHSGHWTVLLLAVLFETTEEMMDVLSQPKPRGYREPEQVEENNRKWDQMFGQRSKGRTKLRKRNFCPA